LSRIFAATSIHASPMVRVEIVVADESAVRSSGFGSLTAEV